MKKMMRKMTGNYSGSDMSFRELYDHQVRFQHEVLTACNDDATYPFDPDVVPGSLPLDEPGWYSYHVNAMTEEMGELMKADKRWKTHRNVHYDPVNKLEELADVMITAMNLAIFSGFTAEELSSAINWKIQENFIKLKS